MATIHFYGKPDCKNNRRQKELLKAAGHELVEYDILRVALTGESLRPYFEDRPVTEWFNPTAPALKSGSVRPERLDKHAALEAMLADRFLIRRPLMRIGSVRTCGFDTGRLKTLIDFTPAPGNRELFEQLAGSDLVTCQNNGKTDCTSTEEAGNG